MFTFACGVLTGAVIAVVSPPAYAWVAKQIRQIKAKAKTLE